MTNNEVTTQGLTFGNPRVDNIFLNEISSLRDLSGISRVSTTKLTHPYTFQEFLWR